MNIQQNKQLRDKLSAAYVLGTLKGGARRRFETYVAQSFLLQREVAEWQARLSPLAEFAPEVNPPAYLWKRISQQLSLSASAQARDNPLWRKLLDSVNFWRGLSLAATAFAGVMLFIVLQQTPTTEVASSSYVAMLVNDQAQPNIVVVGDRKRHTITAKILAQQSVASDKSLELWAIPKQGNPRSLGLIASNGSVTLPLPDNDHPDNVVMLAVSLEPLHGSPSKAGPTGPILFKGSWEQI